MYPALFTLGQFHLYSFSVFLVLAWGVFSFVFWKLLKDNGVLEERVFDLTFYATILALAGGRGGFVLMHPELFLGDILKIFALWVAPGLSLYTALIAAILTLIYLSRRYKVRLGLVLDALALALPAALAVGEVGSFLDGSQVGKITALPWSVRYVGAIGRRHPVQLYELLVLLVIIGIMLYLRKRSLKKSWPYGLLGVWFFAIWSLAFFVLEFFKDSSVYWRSLSANQWVLIIFLGEALGAFYVRGGGRQVIRPLIMRSRGKIASILGEVYAKLSQRRTR